MLKWFISTMMRAGVSMLENRWIPIAEGSQEKRKRIPTHREMSADRSRAMINLIEDRIARKRWSFRTRREYLEQKQSRIFFRGAIRTLPFDVRCNRISDIRFLSRVEIFPVRLLCTYIVRNRDSFAGIFNSLLCHYRWRIARNSAIGPNRLPT